MAGAQYFQSLFSQLSSKACVIDTTPPTFAGIASATFQTDGSAVVTWLAATSTKTPVRYEIYVSAGSVSAGSLFVTANRVAFAPGALLAWRIFVLRDQVTYFMPGQVYTFGIRAVDAQNYSDSNTVILTATALYPNYGTLAATVWDQLKSAHTISGSFGDFLDAKVSLTQTAATALTQYNNLQTTLATLQTAATALTQYNNLIAAIGTPQQASVALTQYNNIQAAIALTQTAATALSQFNTLVSDITATAGSVWDQLKSAHTISGSFGDFLDAKVSLAQLASTALTQYNNLQTAIALVQQASVALTQYNALIAAIGTPQQAATALTQYNNLQTAIALAQTAATALSQFNTLVSDINNTVTTSHFNTIIGTPVTTIAGDIAEIAAETDNIAAIKAQTDKMLFDGNSFIKANAEVTIDDTNILAIKAKTDQLTFAIDGVNAHVNNIPPIDVPAIVHGVWDALLANYQVPDSMGNTMLDILNKPGGGGSASGSTQVEGEIEVPSANGEIEIPQVEADIITVQELT